MFDCSYRSATMMSRCQIFCTIYPHSQVKEKRISLLTYAPHCDSKMFCLTLQGRSKFLHFLKNWPLLQVPCWDSVIQKGYCDFHQQPSKVCPFKNKLMATPTLILWLCLLLPMVPLVQCGSRSANFSHSCYKWPQGTVQSEGTWS